MAQRSGPPSDMGPEQDYITAVSVALLRYNQRGFGFHRRLHVVCRASPRMKRTSGLGSFQCLQALACH